MVKRWGHIGAVEIGQRLFEMLAARSLSELASLPHIGLRVLRDNGAKCVRVAVPIQGACILLTVSSLDHATRNLAKPGWDNLTEVMINSIEDDSEQRSSHGK